MDPGLFLSPQGRVSLCLALVCHPKPWKLEVWMELRSSHQHTSLVEAQVSHVASPNLLVLVTYLCNDHGGVPWSYIFYRDENAWICEHLHTSINVKASFPLSLLYPMRTTRMALGPPCRPPNAVRATSQAVRTALSLHTEGYPASWTSYCSGGWRDRCHSLLVWLLSKLLSELLQIFILHKDDSLFFFLYKIQTELCQNIFWGLTLAGSGLCLQLCVPCCALSWQRGALLAGTATSCSCDVGTRTQLVTKMPAAGSPLMLALHGKPDKTQGLCLLLHNLYSLMLAKFAILAGNKGLFIVSVVCLFVCLILSSPNAQLLQTGLELNGPNSAKSK